MQTKLSAGLLAAGLLLAWSPALSGEEEKAQLILYNGKIITVDPQDRIFEAVAVREGKIMQLGEDAGIRALAGPGCTFIDLKGKTVTPGLIDSHYHLMYYGQQFDPLLLNIRFPEVRSKADLLRVVGEHAKKLKKEEWISGNQGFHIANDEILDRTDIDGVAPENPAYLRHGSGQYAVANSLALRIAGITRDSENPPSSVIVRDSLGNPTGVLSHYPAENLVARHATGYGDRSEARKTEDMERGQQLCLEAGYTSVQDVIVGSAGDILLYRDFARSGQLKVRLYTLLYLHTEQQANQMAATFHPEPEGLFSFNGWKLAMDGGPAPKTVLMYDTTLDMARLSYPYFDRETFNRMVATLHNTGLQVAVHVSGDRGIDMTLTAFEEAQRIDPRTDPRHRIEHGMWPSRSALDRMAAAGVVFSTQPQWIAWHGDSYRETSDSAAMELFLPLKSMIDKGIHVAFGCDVPASLYQEPRYAFGGSVYRKTSAGTVLNPGEKLTIREALRIHTLGSAYAGFAEATTGSLEPGKYADMVVWSHDLYTMKPSEMADLKAEMTIVNGEVLYSTGALVASGMLPEGAEGCMLQASPLDGGRGLRIRFRLPEAGPVRIWVVNEQGQKVETLLSRHLSPGEYDLTWNVPYGGGSAPAPGLYLLVMKSGNRLLREKVLLR